jgi:hypothetical protein
LVTIVVYLPFLLACVENTAEEGEICQAGGVDQVVGIVDCLPELECCLAAEGSTRSSSSGGICVRVESPNAHDVGHAGDGQCPADLFDTGGDSGAGG